MPVYRYVCVCVFSAVSGQWLHLTRLTVSRVLRMLLYMSTKGTMMCAYVCERVCVRVSFVLFVHRSSSRPPHLRALSVLSQYTALKSPTHCYRAGALDPWKLLRLMQGQGRVDTKTGQLKKRTLMKKRLRGKREQYAV